MDSSKTLIVRNPNVTGVEYHRLMLPAHKLSEQGCKMAVINTIDTDEVEGTPILDFLRQFDTVVCNRTISPYGNTVKALDLIKQAGCRLIVDIDDYWELPGYHILYRDFKDSNYAEHITLCLRSADLVTVSTPILADKARLFNKNVEVLENAIDPEQPQWTINKTESERVRFGWIGGICHMPDLSILEDSIGKCYSDEDLINKIQFVYGGFNLEQSIWVGEQKKRVPFQYQECYKFERIFTNHYRPLTPEYKEYLHKFIKDNEPANEHPYRRIWNMDVYNYGTMYDQLDVTLIPLKNDGFNNCKSELKMIESGFKKLPCIVSNVKPYTLLANGKNALTVTDKRNHKDWYKHIKKLAQSESMRNDYAEALYESVKVRYHINTVNEKRKQIWSSVLV